MNSKRLYLIVGLLTVGFLAYVAGEPLLERVQQSSVEQSIREAYNDGYLTKADARRMVGKSSTIGRRRRTLARLCSRQPSANQSPPSGFPSATLSGGRKDYARNRPDGIDRDGGRCWSFIACQLSH
jgi:hypothetical protein